MPLEIACFNASSALKASSSGAHRIELCSSPEVGGLTPSFFDFKSLKVEISIPICVMIRPHGRHFTYTQTEFGQISQDIGSFLDAGADGFVFGILSKEGRVDEERCKELVGKAMCRPCTYHRAFDEIPEEIMDEELEVLIRCGFKRLLTSGGKKTALQGKEVLKMLVEKARGRIDVIVGGGVRSGNIKSLKETGAEWFHSSAIIDEGGFASTYEVSMLMENVDSETN